jgi:MFS family permease
VQSFDFNAFGILAPDIRQTFGLSTPQIDTIATLTSAVPVVFSAHLGYYGDRTNRVRFSAIAGVIWGVTAVVTGLAPVVLVLIIARTVGGVGQLTTETIYPSLLADYYPSGVLGLVFARYRWISQGVGLIGGPLAGVIAAEAGWRVAFVVLAIPTFVFVALLRMLHEPVRGASMGYSLGENPVTSVRDGFRRVRSIRALRRTWAAAFLFGAGTLPLAAVVNNYFHDVYHLGDTARGAVSVIFGLGGMFGMIVGGRISNRQLQKGVIPSLSVVSGLFVLECGVGIVLMSAAPQLWLAIVTTGLLTIGALGFLPAYTTLVAFVSAPRLRAQAYGWSLLFYALGAIVIQAFVIGPILNAYGQRWALAVLGALVALGGVIGVSTRQFVTDDMARAFSGEQLEEPATG